MISVMEFAIWGVLLVLSFALIHVKRKSFIQVKIDRLLDMSSFIVFCYSLYVCLFVFSLLGMILLIGRHQFTVSSIIVTTPSLSHNDSNNDNDDFGNLSMHVDNLSLRGNEIRNSKFS